MLLHRHCNRIGTEHEKIGFDLKTHKRMTYDQIAQVFDRLQARFGWRPMIEAGKVIGELLTDGRIEGER